MTKFITFGNQLMLYTILVGKGQKKMCDHFNRCGKRIPQNPMFFWDKNSQQRKLKRNVLTETLFMIAKE